MSGILNAISCCLWPFLLGGLLGWLAHWLLCKCKCSDNVQHTHTYTPPAPEPLKAADPVQAAAPVAAPVKVAEPVQAAAPVKAAEPVKVAEAAIDLKAAKAAGFSLKHADDLTIVEGIGPKINELFINAGVRTFAQLSQQSVAQMQKVLDGGGARFRLANPQTWAQQAALAAANKWAELKKLQDDLSGGLRK